jgi:hypothetical protein
LKNASGKLKIRIAEIGSCAEYCQVKKQVFLNDLFWNPLYTGSLEETLKVLRKIGNFTQTIFLSKSGAF